MPDYVVCEDEPGACVSVCPQDVAAVEHSVVIHLHILHPVNLYELSAAAPAMTIHVLEHVVDDLYVHALP
jgi:NAD-dependent dihydropyrimidine dehydrogenase PreA subunit